jgi:hypothetical protein
MSSAFARTDEAAALTARTARHFAHKVPVRREQDATRIETRFGVILLRPVADGIEVELSPRGTEADGALRNVFVTHLERFARTPLEIEWRNEDSTDPGRILP